MRAAVEEVINLTPKKRSLFRLLSYSGRRSSAPQQERSGHAKTA